MFLQDVRAIHLDNYTNHISSVGYVMPIFRRR